MSISPGETRDERSRLQTMRSRPRGGTGPQSSSFDLISRVRARWRAAPGPDAKAEVGKSLLEAEALVKTTGAESWRPFIHEERARLAQLTGDEAARRQELREAQRLFLEVGAPIHAERIAKELP